MFIGVRVLLLLAVSVPFLASSPVFAATRNASDCSTAAVQAAVNAASTGDTVQVPAGACSWTGGVTIPTGRDIILKGAGIDSTTINGPAGGIAVLIQYGSSRITGFTFGCGYVQVDGRGWRVDHNKFTCATSQEGVYMRGNSKTSSPKGLVDHNTFINQRILATDYPGTSLSELQGSNHWAVAPQLGTDEAMYVEDNTFLFTQFFNAGDCNYSGRYVFRFNDVQDVYLEAHSVQGFNRACRKWEIYKNTIRQVNRSMYFMMYLRGGVGINFMNAATGTFGTAPNLTINNVRSCRDVGAPVGRADGTAAWDGNASGLSGWLARDQIGAAQDTGPWTATAPPSQTPGAAYFLLNTINGSNMGVAVLAGEACPAGDLNSLHLQPNRDYFTYTASFTGASGVGAGVLAARPATCTAGVGYWATDQGEWNSKQAGPDGQLFRCVAPNTWALHYIPFTYPHPLAQGGVAAPTNLRLQ